MKNKQLLHQLIAALYFISLALGVVRIGVLIDSTTSADQESVAMRGEIGK